MSLADRLMFLKQTLERIPQQPNLRRPLLPIEFCWS
jgi:hypothetical protein